MNVVQVWMWTQREARPLRHRQSFSRRRRERSLATLVIIPHVLKGRNNCRLTKKRGGYLQDRCCSERVDGGLMHVVYFNRLVIAKRSLKNRSVIIVSVRCVLCHVWLVFGFGCNGVVLNIVRESATPDSKENKQANAGSRLFSKAFSAIYTYVQRECSAEPLMRSILSLKIFTSLLGSRQRFFIAMQFQ